MGGWTYTPEFMMEGLDPATVQRTGNAVGFRHETGAWVEYGSDHRWHAVTAEKRSAGRHLYLVDAMAAALAEAKQ